MDHFQLVPIYYQFVDSEMDCKRSFDATELTLGLPGTTVPPRCNKRMASATSDDDCTSKHSNTKVQVVGWPPVRSFRRNSFQKHDLAEDGSGIYVKVSMVGAPYLRKIDLKVYNGYKDLRVALEDMFNSFSVGEYVITYEDKDGDWMMVGDVPFEMFISTCKRLRIMKGSEARGLGSSS